jgi:hypothetical protein
MQKYSLAAVALAIMSVVSGCGSEPTPIAPALRVVAQGRTMILSWDLVPHADSYRVSRNGSDIATVSATTYTDKDLSDQTQVCYTVRAMNGPNTSPESASSCATALNDYDGLWVGTTTDGRAISFRVQGRTISDLTTTASGSECGTTHTELFEGLTATIDNRGWFRVQAERTSIVKLSVSGWFESEKAVQGATHDSDIYFPSCRRYGYSRPRWDARRSE